MKYYLLIAMLFMVSCATVNVGTVDYCHNQDGSVNKDDPRCVQQQDEAAAADRMEREGNAHNNRR